jgi:hypothetical protein
MTASSSSRLPPALISERPPPGPSSWRTRPCSLRPTRSSQMCGCRCSYPFLRPLSCKRLTYGPKRSTDCLKGTSDRLKGSQGTLKTLNGVLASTERSALQRTEHSANGRNQNGEQKSGVLNEKKVTVKRNIFYVFSNLFSVHRRRSASSVSRLVCLTLSLA